MNFPAGGNWYPVEHDELLRIVGEDTSWLSRRSWMEREQYHSRGASRTLRERLAPYRVGWRF